MFPRKSQPGHRRAIRVAKRTDAVLDTASQPVIPPTPRAEPSPTGAIRTLGSNPATAPVVLHPGDSISARRRVLYTAQEDVGIWRVPLTAGGFGRPRLIEKVTSFGVPATYDEQSEECVVAGEDQIGRAHV